MWSYDKTVPTNGISMILDRGAISSVKGIFSIGWSSLAHHSEKCVCITGYVRSGSNERFAIQTMAPRLSFGRRPFVISNRVKCQPISHLAPRCQLLPNRNYDAAADSVNNSKLNYVNCEPTCVPLIPIYIYICSPSLSLHIVRTHRHRATPATNN